MCLRQCGIRLFKLDAVVFNGYKNDKDKICCHGALYIIVPSSKKVKFKIVHL